MIKKNNATASAAKIFVGSNTINDSPSNDKTMPNKVKSQENLNVSPMVIALKREETKTDQAESQK